MTKHCFAASAVIESPAWFSLTGLDTVAVPAPMNGMTVKGLKIFRVGTFTDSLGRTNTWTQQDLDDMVKNFAMLRGAQVITEEGTISYDGVLPWVPVRTDHTSKVKDVVGYFSNVYTDPTKPGFLLADIDFTEPEAHAAYQRGTYRNRSAEIGGYEDNAGNLTFPVMLGIAFVDLPAVEGLAFSRHSPAAPNQGEHIVPEPTPTPGTPPANHQAPPPYTFMIAGNQSTDFGAVQAYIATLEQSHRDLVSFKEATIKSGREAFVTKLAADSKIANTQLESFKGLALGMTVEQFELFKAGFDAAPTLDIFGKAPSAATLGPDGKPVNAGAALSPEAQRLADLKDIVTSHRQSGMSPDAVKNTNSYKELVSLGVNNF